MTTQDRFGGLRALLQETPSERLWWEIVDELALWEDEARERVALPYVSDHLDRWPDEVERSLHEEVTLWMRTGRASPGLWLINRVWLEDLDALALWESAPWANRVRSVELGCGALWGAEDGREAARRLGALGVRRLMLNGLAAHNAHDALLGALEGVEALDLVYGEVSGLRSAHRIAKNQALRGALRSLRLTIDEPERAHAVDGLCALARASLFDGLASLDLSGSPLDARAMAALAGRDQMAGLKELVVYDCGLDAQAARIIAAGSWRTGLERLSINGAVGGALPDVLAGLPALRRLRWPLEEVRAEEVAAQRGRWPARLGWPFEWMTRGEEGLGEALAEGEELGRCERLRLNQRDGLERVLESPHLTGLRSLSLTTPSPTRGVETLLSGPATRTLTELSVVGIAPDAATLGALLAPGVLVRLEILRLPGAPQDAACVEALRAGVQRLRRLTLSSYGEGSGAPEALAQLLETAQLGRLEELELFGQPELWRLMAALARNPTLGALRSLRLSGSGADAGVEALVTSALAGQLASLRLDACGIGDAGASALAGSPLVRRLRGFNGRDYAEAPGVLVDNQIGLAGALALLGGPHAARLVALDLRDNPLSDEALGVLATRIDDAPLGGFLKVTGDEEAPGAAALLATRAGAGGRIVVEAPREE